jgi:hypothetical protein
MERRQQRDDSPTYLAKPRGRNEAADRWLHSPLLDKLALTGALALFALVAVRQVYQWDFVMFVDSARQYMSGLNPYRGSGLSFFHPPITLYLYGLFTHLPIAAGKALWLALHAVAIATLFMLWNRHFVRLEARWPTILFLVLGHNAALYSDITAGNVSSFEQLGIWMAFACLLRGRYGWFCIALAVCSQFKMIPIFFSALLLIVPPKREWGWFAASLAAFAGIFLLNRWLDPHMWDAFWSSAQQLDERGGDNAAILPFLRDALDLLGQGFSRSTLLDEGIYLAVAATVGVISLVEVLRYRQRAGQFDRVLVICFACAVFALGSPRFKGYSAILLLVPTLYLIRSPWRTNLLPLGVFVVGALAMFPHGSTLLPFKEGFALGVEYIPLFARVAVWVGYLLLMRQLCGKPGMREADPVPSAAA